MVWVSYSIILNIHAVVVEGRLIENKAFIIVQLVLYGVFRSRSGQQVY